MGEKLFNIELTSYECNELIIFLYDFIGNHKSYEQYDMQKINDLAQKIKTQFFEQGNL